MIANNEKNLASVIHFSALGKYFFPLGNLIFQILLWVFTKDKNSFYDQNGKAAINFQLSMLLYGFSLGMVLLALIFIFVLGRAEEVAFQFEFYDFDYYPFSPGVWLRIFPVWLILTAVFAVLAYTFFELYAVITGGLQALHGKVHKYPLSITFIK